MNRIARSAFIGIVAFALIVGTPLSAQAAHPLTHVEHPNVLVSLDPEASSQNEVTIAAFPNDRNVLVATARDTRQASGFSWAGYYRSTDGGDTWQNALVPGFPGDTSAEGLSSPVHDAGWTIGSDPVITADRDGRVYLAWLSFGPTTTEFAGWLVLTRYSDFGATYDFTSVVYRGHDTPSDKLGGPGNSRVTDKEWIAVDDTGGSCDGNLYMPWALFEGSHGTKIVLQRSTNGGMTWTPILPLSHSPNTQNQGATVAVGPGGEVYVAWEDFHKDQILFTRSLDCGQTFEMERGISSIVPVPEPLPGSAYRLDSFPRMAVSQTTGSVFVTWADYRTGDADVVLTRSADGGASWSDPARVNDAATNHQIFPAITTFEGRVDIAFYDSRNDPDGKLLDVYYAESDDDGVSFLPNVPVTDAPFDPNLGITAGGAAFLGDYNGIASNAAGVHPIWADNRNVATATPRDQDLYTGTVS
ncbi:MAG TPA: sialidase family protein [Thermoplasmata archaeon]|nr:sialidase family protein [Thermoplasmata archaeon]